MSKNKIVQTCKALVKKACQPMNAQRIRSYNSLSQLNDNEVQELKETLETLAEVAIRQVNRLKDKGLDLLF